MKYRTTKKAIKENYCYIIGIGYCDAQNLLNYEEAESYCAGAYGWSCDNYRIRGGKYNVLISTGYNYINGLKYDYEELRELDKKARHILCSNTENPRKEIENLLVNFCNKVVEDNTK